MTLKLTARQIEVARLIARDYTNKAIAAELCLAPGTVVTHVDTIIHKLGVKSRVGVAVWVVRNDMTVTLEEGQP
jgi:two-component system, NarL family, nitrate/nitrite response regulator NarL